MSSAAGVMLYSLNLNNPDVLGYLGQLHQWQAGHFPGGDQIAHDIVVQHHLPIDLPLCRRQLIRC
ncbi:hypothetical protein D3C73_1541160 [compost metagenome]